MKTPLLLGASCPSDSGSAGVNADWLFLLRCGEGAASSALADGTPAGARTMTVTASPAVAGSLLAGGSSTGARSFNGTTQYAGRAAADGDEAEFAWAYDSPGWGAHLWALPDALAATMTIIELGEYASPETLATNVQMNLAILTTGAVRLSWEYGSGGSGVSLSTAAGLVVAGTTVALGVAVRPSRLHLQKIEVRLYVNGRCVAQADDLEPPTGGTSARWIIGASRANGSGVGSPGEFFDGTLDDIVVCRFAPEHEFFRDLFAASVRDYYPNVLDYLGLVSLAESEVHTRVLLEVGAADAGDPATLPQLERVNLTDVDLSRCLGFDPLLSVRVGRSGDDQHWYAEIEAVPRFGAWNLSPFVNSEASNDLSDNALAPDGDVYDALLRSTRRIKVEIALMPHGSAGVAWDGSRDLHHHFDLVFDGHIVAVSPEADTAKITCVDGARGIARGWVEPSADGEDRVYGSVGGILAETELQRIIDDNDPARYDIVSIDDVGAAVEIVVFQSASALGEGKPCIATIGDDVRVEGTTNFNGLYALALGTSTTMRTLTTPGAFAAETSGTARLAQHLSYKGGRLDVWTAVSPDWYLLEFNVPPTSSVLDLLTTIAGKIGWQVAMRYDNVRRQYRLAFYEAAESGGNMSVRPEIILDVSRMSTTDERVRNVGAYEYADEDSKDPTQEYGRRLVAARDLESARSWGRSAFRVAVGQDSLLTTSVEATRAIDAVIADLKNADAAGSVAVPLVITPEPSDIVQLFGEEGGGFAPSIFAGAKAAAVHEVGLEVSGTTARTTLGFSKFGVTVGSRSVSRRSWYDQLFDIARHNPSLGMRGLTTPDAPTVDYLGALNSIRTATIHAPQPSVVYGAMDTQRLWEWTEFHMSTSSGFTPSESTLLGVGKGSTYTVTRTAAGAALAGATTYYVKVVYKDGLRLRSQASGQASFST